MTLLKLAIFCLFWHRSVAVITENDKSALLALYDATDGPNWGITWDIGGDLCEEDEVECNAGGSVTFLVLNSISLSGVIPPEIGNLASLIRLDLSWNDISGTIPPEIGNFVSLTRLWLNNNVLSGTIPPQIGNLASLQMLWLQGNDLSCTIPPDIGSLSSLTQLKLDGNKLLGQIPQEIGDLNSLTTLLLAGNEFSCPYLNYSTMATTNDHSTLAAQTCPDGTGHCTPNPCQNGGTCTLGGACGFTCQCVGFGGPTCEGIATQPGRYTHGGLNWLTIGVTSTVDCNNLCALHSKCVFWSYNNIKMQCKTFDGTATLLDVDPMWESSA